jgi:hypothetical protein
LKSTSHLRSWRLCFASVCARKSLRSAGHVAGLVLSVFEREREENPRVSGERAFERERENTREGQASVCAAEKRCGRAASRTRAPARCATTLSVYIAYVWREPWRTRHFLLECEAYAGLRPQHGFDAGDMWQETNVGWLSICMPPRARWERCLCSRLTHIGVRETS